MKTLEISHLLQKDEILSPAYITLDNDGCVDSVSTSKPSKVSTRIEGIAVPGIPNAHSHAFQYAMAGLAEESTRGDSFWTWREKMYELALTVDPEGMESIAFALYSSMVRKGYTSVAEFHYLHHDPKGVAYSDPCEMGHALFRAAKRSGIALTLVPVYYETGGFNQPAQSDQRRFVFKNPDSYLDLLARYQSAYPDNIAAGVHSLRAAPLPALAQIYREVKDLPRHIHIAEQVKEVKECKAVLGKSPVQALLDAAELGPNDHLVHATHITVDEIKSLSSIGAHVVLCPSTEGNLGDGFFPIGDWLAKKGKFSIGSDSHVGLSPFEEFRWLDYGRRLNTLTRESLGLESFWNLFQSGHASLNREVKNFFEKGRRFEALILVEAEPLLSNPKHTLSSLVYSLDSSSIKETWLGSTRAAEFEHPGPRSLQAFRTL